MFDVAGFIVTFVVYELAGVYPAILRVFLRFLHPLLSLFLVHRPLIAR